MEVEKENEEKNLEVTVNSRWIDVFLICKCGGLCGAR